MPRVRRGSILIALLVLVTGCTARERPPLIFGGIEGSCPKAEPELRRGTQQDLTAKLANQGSMAVRATGESTAAPLTGVSIEISADSVFPSRLGQLSDRRGFAEWRGLQSREYWLRLQLLGYSPVVAPVVIRPGASDTLMVEMHVAPVGCTPP